MASRISLRRALALARYHRPSQFAWRLYRTGQRVFRRKLPERFVFSVGGRAANWKAGGCEAFERVARRRIDLWSERSLTAAETAEGVFRFLNQARDLKRATDPGGFQIEWNPDAPRLWRFQLQCQESLLELAERVGADAAYRLVLSWLSEPRHQHPTRDPDAWHPFCISRRIPVWLSLASCHAPPEWVADRFWNSVADQVRWLHNNLEWDLGGNHLLENLTALYLAECFLDLTDNQGEPDNSNRRRRRVEQQLRIQLDQQILPSGEHVERTPTYHALMMVCVAQCVEAARFAQSGFANVLANQSSRMARFADFLRLPHGGFPLLGDSTEGETPDLDRLLQWTRSHGTIDPEDIPSDDYWTGNANDRDRLIFDIGPVACEHLPAHGHADLFQVCATLGGKDAIVDTGTFEYESTLVRLASRKTAAHNVMQLDDRELCDVWSSFRMGDRAKAIWRSEGTCDEVQWCVAAHDHFGCLAGRLVLASHAQWTILDWYANNRVGHEVQTRLHWHPDWNLESDAEQPLVNVIHPEFSDRIYKVAGLGEGIRLTITPADYYPTFGVRQTGTRLELSKPAGRAGWLGFNLALQPSAIPEAPSVSIDSGRLNATVGQRTLSIELASGLARVL